MIAFCRPTADTICDFLEAQDRLELSYSPAAGAATTPPPGFSMDHTRVKLGEGGAVFQAGKAALQRWEHFRLGWVEALPSPTPIQVGAVVAIMARLVGLWWLNACRIVAVVDEADRFGFTYATLPDHAETGQERFLIEWDRADDSVWYDIRALSRPRHLLARLGYPLARRMQKRFARGSAAAMLRAAGQSPASS
jgi:uncharacterized protein (UPF0548 family)